ncbi:MAG: KEOPS complex subunit Pcc1 [Ignisphaera sp.]
MRCKGLHQGSINICFKLNEEEKFRVIVDSIYPELVYPVSVEKTCIDVKIDPEKLCLIIEIDTYSTSQLRAIINSILYLVHITLSTLNIMQKSTNLG